MGSTQRKMSAVPQPERTGRGSALDSLVVRILTNGRAHARGAPPQQQWVLVLRPLPPVLQQRPLPPLLLPPPLLPLKPKRTPRFYGTRVPMCLPRGSRSGLMARLAIFAATVGALCPIQRVADECPLELIAERCAAPSVMANSV